MSSSRKRGTLDISKTSEKSADDYRNTFAFHHFPCVQSKMSTTDEAYEPSEDITDFQCNEQKKTYVRGRLKLFATILFFLAAISTALVLVDTQISLMARSELKKVTEFQKSGVNSSKQEVDTWKKNAEKYNIISNTSRSFLTIISIGMCINLYIYYKYLFMLKVMRFFYPKEMSFFRATPLVKKWVIECMVCLIHVPPFVRFFYDVPVELQLFVFARLYLLGRYLKEKHELMNSQSTRFLASVTKTELTAMFLFKTFFMHYPFQMILLAYIILLFIGGYGVWLIEARHTYMDTVWMLIITMTTVGFGDLTPKTILGRFLVGITAIVGIFLMALFISLVNEALMLQRSEKRILSYVENQESMRRRKITALNAISMWFKYHAHNKNHRKIKKDSQSLLGHNDCNPTKVNILYIAKGKVLETRMYKAINEWKKIKNERGGGFFAQEFMIEDMKILVNDLNSQMKEMDEKIEALNQSIQQMQKKDKSEVTLFNNPDLKKENKKEIDQFYSLLKIHNHKRSNKPTAIHNTTRWEDDHRNLAYHLLRNQAKLMNSALDDIYYKTRQDICDMENIISSLHICSDADALQSIPSKDSSMK